MFFVFLLLFKWISRDFRENIYERPFFWVGGGNKWLYYLELLNRLTKCVCTFSQEKAYYSAGALLKTSESLQNKVNPFTASSPLYIIWGGGGWHAKARCDGNVLSRDMAYVLREALTTCQTNAKVVCGTRVAKRGETREIKKKPYWLRLCT